MQKLDTILFDLDGTLIDTNNIIINSFRATFEKHFPQLDLSDETIKTFIGPTLQQTFGEYTTDPFLIQEMIETYRSYYVEYEIGNFELYPNVTEVLTDLKDKGFHLGIVTSKFREAAWPSYTGCKLDELFDSFTALDDVDEPKPHRNPIDTALSHFPNHQKVLMIGDNQSDILAGKNAGVYSAGVAWSLKGESHLQEVNPDFMLQDMNDIYRVINKIERMTS